MLEDQNLIEYKKSDGRAYYRSTAGYFMDGGRTKLTN
jgi:hypothetical protein